MEQSHPPYVPGAMQQPRTLNRWLDINAQNGPLRRTQTFITTPQFNIAFTWNRYSDIIATFNFEAPNNFSVKKETFTFSSIGDVRAQTVAIAWLDSSGKMHRYFLYISPGAVLYFQPVLYTRQLIMKNFRIEIWSAVPDTVFFNPINRTVGTIMFSTSVLGNNDYRFAVDSALQAPDPIATSFQNNNFGGTPIALPFVFPNNSVPQTN